VRMIIIIKNIIQLEWEVTGATEKKILAMEKDELEMFFARKYLELEVELQKTTDAKVSFLDTEVEVFDTSE
jgi:uncharacterized HAD superfamily protein